jgi:hypothetical protein
MKLSVEAVGCAALDNGEGAGADDGAELDAGDPVGDEMGGADVAHAPGQVAFAPRATEAMIAATPSVRRGDALQMTALIGFVRSERADLPLRTGRPGHRLRASGC